MTDFFPPLTDRELVAQAQARRESNRDYRPTADELAAIDRQIIAMHAIRMEEDERKRKEEAKAKRSEYRKTDEYRKMYEYLDDIGILEELDASICNELGHLLEYNGEDSKICIFCGLVKYQNLERDYE